MRPLADADRIRRFMRLLARAARAPARVYLTGGATAVLSGWRQSTVDVDLKLVPDDDALLRAIPEIKESLHINVELAAPDDFIPVRSGWQDRSPFIATEGPLTFLHFDLVAQALAKIERGHARDREDVLEMLRRGMVDAEALRSTFAAIEPELYRYPAVDPPSFRRALDDLLASSAPDSPRRQP
jgi:Nucleotidyltransferase of unknown function (DUF6036)